MPVGLSDGVGLGEAAGPAKQLLVSWILAAVHGVVGVPGLGVHDADHPVRHDLPGDPPPRLSVRVLRVVRVDELDVLAGDQRKQPDRVGRRTRWLLTVCTERGEHRQSVPG